MSESLNPAPIAQATAKLMDTIDEDYPEGELTGALIIAEVAYVDEEGDNCTAYRWQTADDSPSRTVGMAFFTLTGMLE